MVVRHLLDSLTVVPHVAAAGGRIIDVGTGGGLPGVVLAIMFPAKHFTLLDSNGKKTRFLFQVKTALKLDNMQVENCRVEQHQPALPYDAVISRAFASLRDMTGGCAHLLAEGGCFLAMKGHYPEDELSALAKRYKVQSSHPLRVPGDDGERHLLVLTAAAAVPSLPEGSPM
jgi:16S rRNA (guanine527-N7)-methyltransferase